MIRQQAKTKWLRKHKGISGSHVFTQNGFQPGRKANERLNERQTKGKRKVNLANLLKLQGYKVLGFTETRLGAAKMPLIFNGLCHDGTHLTFG